MDVKSEDRRPLPRLGTDPQSVRNRVEGIERLMERLFTIPGLGRPVGLDAILSLIPFVGAIPDFFFRSNTRNLRIIKRHLDKHHAGTATIDARPR